MGGSTVLILSALATEARHGSGVIEEVTAASGGRVRLRPGTVHAALDRLVGRGLVAVDRSEAVAGAPRRYYRLTGAGASALAVSRVPVRGAARAGVTPA